MSLQSMVNRGLGFGYRVLGEPAQFTPAGGQAAPVRVIFTQDGAAMLDGMMQSVGPSLRIRVSEAPAGVARDSTFSLTDRGEFWRAREQGLPINDGTEWLVQLGRAAV